MNLRILRTGPRLGLGLGLILATCLLTLVVAFATLAADRAALLRTLDQAGEQQALAVALRTALLSSAVSIRNMGLQATVEGAQKHEAEALRQRKAQEVARNALAGAAPPGASRDSLARLTAIDQKMAAEFAEAVGLASQFNTEQAAKLITERIDPLLAQAVQELDAFATLQRQQADAAKQLAEARSQRTALALGLASLALLSGAALLGWRLTLSITRPIAEALQTTQRVQAGDLDCEIRDQGRDEAAQLLRGLRAMRDGLSGIVRGVRASAENISTGAGEISAGNADLSQRTESQAANLQQTAASIEQINAAVRSNAEIARQASQMAGSARQAASQGGQLMDGVVAAMEQMRTESGRIGEIVGVIDGIAFQTNILALNAAVEAARAGEQGRGFAVVASEVRTLAGRSASAAREIKALIAASAQRVAAGSQLVDNAGGSVKDIVAQVQGVAGLLEQISASAAEQTRGIGQINQAIVQLDQVTQQNAALVEEAAAAAASLNQQAAGMVSAVSVFKLH